MKKIALVWTFVAALAAQGQGAQDPKGELAAVIAVEEQERDLGKAETMYRELLAGTKLSVEARGLANQRLGRMLQRLGRVEEAKAFLAAAAKGEVVTLDDVTAGLQQQDVEREKALREKARELVQQILKQQAQNWEGPLHGIADSRLAEQLLWIGEAAVPEVIAALQAERELTGNWAQPSRRLAAEGLAGFLWRTGGTVSAAFLSSCAKVENVAYRRAMVVAAFQAEQPAMLAEAARFLNDPDDEVVKALLETGDRQGGRQLSRRFEPQQIVDGALRGPQRGKIRLLGWAARMSQFDTVTLAKLHALVREGLQSTDPEFGNASNQFLLSTASQASIEGLLLLLQELPKMKGQNSVPNSLPQPSPQMQGRTGAESRFTAEQAATLLPALEVCVRALGAGSEEASRRRQWLEFLMWQVAQASDASVVPTVLQWMDLGYTAAWYALDGRITTANSKDVFARFDRIQASGQQYQLLGLLAKGDLPSDLFPALRDKADQLRPTVPNEIYQFGRAMAKTGNPEAADWILAEWRRAPGNQQSMSAADSMIELGRRTQAENVRAAMRTLAVALPGRPDDLLLALLALHDEPALDLLAKTSGQLRRGAPHPYATKAERFQVTPLHYLLYENPDPPHGFTDEQVIGVLQKIAASGIPQEWAPNFFSVGAIKDRLLLELARLAVEKGQDGVGVKHAWIDAVTLVARERRQPELLTKWLKQMLASRVLGVRSAVLVRLDKETVISLRTEIEPLLKDEEVECAVAAAEALMKNGVAAGEEWLNRLLRNRHVPVRWLAVGHVAGTLGAAGAKLVMPLMKDPGGDVRTRVATFLGAIVSKEAVPELIALLRDSDERVRAAASEALTRIRFYHEQQAHWDRVLKGLDASAASAAEKLLLQAKPDAPKAQRLLAIQSLGTLGAPEALPFLIDWTTDTDAEIAVAAKAAITQIHLNPHK